jgi:hypothetical protein
MTNEGPAEDVFIAQRRPAAKEGSAQRGPAPPGTSSRSGKLLGTLRTSAHDVQRAWTDRRKAWDMLMGWMGVYRRDRRKSPRAVQKPASEGEAATGSL